MTLVVTTLALLAQWLLGSELLSAPFLLAIPAVLASAWYGGLGPGLLATALCAVGVELLLVPAPGSRPGAELLQALQFLGVSGLITFLCVRARAALRSAPSERAEAAEAERRAAFLAQAGAVLSSSLDASATIQSVVQLTVPEIADRCLVSMKKEDGTLEHVALAHIDPSQLEPMWELVRRFPLSSTAPYGPASVARSGQGELVSEITDSMLASIAAGPEHLDHLRGLGLRSYMCVPLQARGQVLGTLTLVLVETERRYAGAQLTMAGELARQVGLALDNARLYQEAHDAIKAREELLSMASHELRNPLNALVLYLRAFLNSAQRNSAVGLSLPRILDRLRKIDGQVHRMSRLVSDFLDVSHIVAGRIIVNPERVDLSELVQEVAARFRDELKDLDSPILVQESEPVVGHWDRTRIDEIITNLLSNAIKYGEGQPVEIKILSTVETAWLTVIDHGMGIPLEAQARIFERFERAVPGKRYEGSGLGLWIVRSVLDSMGGSIQVSSAPGAGATFTVTLPRNLHDDAARPLPATREASPP